MMFSQRYKKMGPREEYQQLEKYLDSLGYPWIEETDNKAYQLFLS